MCNNCEENEDSLYPDLGKGSMMGIDIDKTWMTADKTQGIRIAQTRKVDYMGPEGVLSRNETHCIYVGWYDVEETLKMMLALQMKAHDDEKD